MYWSENITTLFQVHWEAEVQKRKADHSSGAEESRVGTDQRHSEKTRNWLLGLADGSALLVHTHTSAHRGPVSSLTGLIVGV